MDTAVNLICHKFHLPVPVPMINKTRPLGVHTLFLAS